MQKHGNSSRPEATIFRFYTKDQSDLYMLSGITGSKTP